MASHNQHLLPDVLRPTELNDFGDAFRRTPRPGRTLVAVVALAALLALGQFITGGPAELAGDSLAAAADLYRS
jgi:hypothetical protein